jgi:peptide/nickel transport system substrate-binding protein
MKDYAPVVPLYVDVQFTLRGSKVDGVFIDSIFGYPQFTNTYVKQ